MGSRQKGLSGKVRARQQTLAIVVVGALVCAAVAAADNYQYNLLPGDQLVAKHIVLSRVDLPALKLWKGGAVKPDETSTDLNCRNGFQTKESDLMVTGDAETKYDDHGSTIDTEAIVFKTATMAKTDWGRQLAPGMFPCLREIVGRGATASRRLVSFSKLTVPRLGDGTIAFRAVFAISAANRPTIRILLDFVFFQRGRAEVNVELIAAALAPGDPQVLRAADIRVATILGAKIPPT
jgi:hypothetical protein